MCTAGILFSCPQKPFPCDRAHASEEIIVGRRSPINTEVSSQILPQSEFVSLHAQLVEKPHNPTLWKRLIELAEQSGDPETIKIAFDSLLKQYPNTVRALPGVPLELSHFSKAAAQISYISHYLDNPTTFGEAEALFTPYMKHSPSVDLFLCYLNYVRQVILTWHRLGSV